MNNTYKSTSVVQFDSSTVAYVNGVETGLSWPGYDPTDDLFRNSNNLDASSSILLVENTDDSKQIIFHGYSWGIGFLDVSPPLYEPIAGTFSVSGGTYAISIAVPNWVGADSKRELNVALAPGQSLAFNMIAPTSDLLGSDGWSLTVSYSIVDKANASTFFSAPIVATEEAVGGGGGGAPITSVAPLTTQTTTTAVSTVTTYTTTGAPSTVTTYTTTGAPSTVTTYTTTIAPSTTTYTTTIAPSTTTYTTTAGIAGTTTTAVPLTTSWDKALQFVGDARSPEYGQLKWNGASTSPVRMEGQARIIAANSDSSKTADSAYARPWAVACVFNFSGGTGQQVIWTQGEGAATTDDNIALEVSAYGTGEGENDLRFTWGRETSGYNTYSFGAIDQDAWYGVYVESPGERLDASDATAANLSDAIRLRLVNLSTNAVSTPTGSWSTTGISMGESLAGTFSIGGLTTTRSFNGKVASCVVTTILRDVTKPTDTEIAMMVRDPLEWLDTYKVGNDYRRPNSPWVTTNFNLSGSDNSKSATQVWLMGDGTNDAYSVIRNQVAVNDSSTTALQMTNMESGDIVDVSISGLS